MSEYGAVRVNLTSAWRWFGLLGYFGGSCWGFRPCEVIKEQKAPHGEGRKRDGVSACPVVMLGMIKPANLQSHSKGLYQDVTHGVMWEQRNARNRCSKMSFSESLCCPLVAHGLSGSAPAVGHLSGVLRHLSSSLPHPTHLGLDR